MDTIFIVFVTIFLAAAAGIGAAVYYIFNRQKVKAIKPVSEQPTAYSFDAQSLRPATVDYFVSTKNYYPSIEAFEEVDTQPTGKIVTIKKFESKILYNERNILIYLPASYDKDKNKCYPVLYAQDGQNVFFSRNSAGSAGWKLKDCLDSLTAQNMIDEVIVVGICCHKISEYTPVPHPTYAGGDAENYLKFMIEELMPYINSNYRTLRGPENTILMGSALGALLSIFAAAKYPRYFTKVIAISPSIWWADRWIIDFVKASKLNPDLKIWIDSGTAEEAEDRNDNGLIDMLDDSRDLLKVLFSKGFLFEKNILYHEVLGGTHNEISWGKRVFMPLLFMLGKEKLKESRIEIAVPFSVLSPGRKVYPIPEIVYTNGIKASPVWLDMHVDNKSFELNEWCCLSSNSEGSAQLSWEYRGHFATRRIQSMDGLVKKFNVVLNIKVPSDTPSNSDVYIVGNIAELGRWNPSSTKMKKISDTIYFYEFSVPPDSSFEFKIVLDGSWDKVEQTETGDFVENRLVTVTKDETIDITVQKWADKN